MDHSSGLVFRLPQAASHRRAAVYFCSAVLTHPNSAGRHTGQRQRPHVVEPRRLPVNRRGTRAKGPTTGEWFNTWRLLEPNRLHAAGGGRSAVLSTGRSGLSQLTRSRRFPVRFRHPLAHQPRSVVEVAKRCRRRLRVSDSETCYEACFEAVMNEALRPSERGIARRTADSLPTSRPRTVRTMGIRHDRAGGMTMRIYATRTDSAKLVKVLRG